MRRVLSITNLKKLPDGFRSRWATRSIDKADVAALRRIGLKPDSFDSIRSERTTGVARRQARPSPIVVPKDQGEAQLLHFMKNQDLIPKYTLWPHRFKKLSIKTHKKNNERFLMTMFYLLSEMNPAFIPDFVLAKGTKNIINSDASPSWELVRGTYDDKAQRQVESIIAKAQTDPAFLLRYEKLFRPYGGVNQ